MQTLICYICLCMGCSENLRKFNFKFVKNVNGLVDIRFELKEEYNTERSFSINEFCADNEEENKEEYNEEFE